MKFLLTGNMCQVNILCCDCHYNESPKFIVTFHSSIYVNFLFKIVKENLKTNILKGREVRLRGHLWSSTRTISPFFQLQFRCVLVHINMFWMHHHYHHLRIFCVISSPEYKTTILVLCYITCV